MLMSTRKKLFSGIFVLAVVAAALFVAFQANRGTRADTQKGGPPVPVTTATVVTKTVPVRVYAIGNVEPFTTVALKARVDGQIVSVHFKEGDEVRQGSVLFEIDPRPFAASLRQAQANLLKDKALLDRVGEQRLVLFHGRLCLRERDGERTRVDLEEQRVFPDLVAFLECDREDLAVDAGLDRHRGVRLDVPHRGEVHRNGFPDDRRDGDRDGGRGLLRRCAGPANKLHRGEAASRDHGDAEKSDDDFPAHWHGGGGAIRPGKCGSTRSLPSPCGSCIDRGRLR